MKPIHFEIGGFDIDDGNTLCGYGSHYDKGYELSTSDTERVTCKKCKKKLPELLADRAEEKRKRDEFEAQLQ